MRSRHSCIATTTAFTPCAAASRATPRMRRTRPRRRSSPSSRGWNDSREGGLPGEEEGDYALGAVVGAGRGASQSPEEAVVDRLDVDAALARVTPDFRAAVVLRDLCGLEYSEIAEILDIPLGTVRSRIARGRAAVADLLSGNLAAPSDRPIPSQ